MKISSLFVAALGAISLVACSPANGDSPTVDVSGVEVSFVSGDVIMGDENAPLEIIEYASTTCGHCRNFHKTHLARIKEEFIDTGKAKLIFRDLPTAPAPVSAASGALARCAGEEKYYDVLDDIFTHQYELLQATRTQGGAMKELIAIGGRHGLNEQQVRACVQSPDVLAEINRTADLANADGVTSTPQLIVNGENAGDAIRSYEALATFLNKKLGIEEPRAENEETASPAASETETPAETAAE